MSNISHEYQYSIEGDSSSCTTKLRIYHSVPFVFEETIGLSLNQRL